MEEESGQNIQNKDKNKSKERELDTEQNLDEEKNKQQVCIPFWNFLTSHVNL